MRVGRSVRICWGESFAVIVDAPAAQERFINQAFIAMNRIFGQSMHYFLTRDCSPQYWK
jgi:hypothetical protein